MAKYSKTRRNSMKNDLPISIKWERALIRSGFLFQKNCDKYSFEKESEANQEYFCKILREISLEGFWNPPIFSPPCQDVDENIWLNAIEKTHGGAEGGDADELEIMDTHSSGLVRWMNDIGIVTSYSCDGHGKNEHCIQITKREHSYLFNICLHLLSGGRWKYTKNTIVVRQKGKHQGSLLLEVAETIYMNRDELRDFIRIAEKVSYKFKSSRLVKRRRSPGQVAI